LAATGLVLQNNGGDDLPITVDGPFTFATAGVQGAGYAVSVKTQPSNLSQTCTVTNGSGSIGTSNVTNVSVTCTTDTFTIGGSVTGLAGSGLVLQNNGGDNLAVDVNAPFVFGTALADGTGYAVSVLIQPSSPAQTCEVTNGSGTLAGQNVGSVLVTCRLNCLVNSVAGVTDTGTIEREACDILQIGPNYSAGSNADVMWSSGSVILIDTETRIEEGATINAAVCGQSLCEVSDAPMPAGCHFCVTDICAVNPSCCSEDFDSTCVEQVSTVCGLACE
jgi:hypothetical protein